MKTKLFLMTLLLTVVTTAMADELDGDNRRWALHFGLTPNRPTTTLDQTSTYGDKPASTGGPNFYGSFEYYLPGTQLSVTGGYSHEEMTFYGGDVSTDMSQITLGGRWYPAPQNWSIQPYVGASTCWNVSGRNESGSMSSVQIGNYDRNYRISRPLLSVAPTVGADLYVCSSLALEFEYGYRMAINGHTAAVTTYNADNREYKMRSAMHRHALSIGLKVTFPFHFTSNDFNGLIDSIFNSIR